MKIVTPAQMNEIDRLSINQFGIPGVVLMENAALRVVDEVIKMLGTVSGKSISVFAGKGSNGGDAFAAARHLYNKGARVDVYILAYKKDISGDAAVNLSILEKSGVETKELVEGFQLTEIKAGLSGADLVVDGIFGTGLKGEVKGLAAEVIRTINNSRKPVIAIDIPSGVSGETGRVPGVCIKACKTVTFGLPKIGLVIHPGCEFTGELAVADIGIPGKVIEHIDIKTHIIEGSHVAKLIPLRRNESNKSDYGRVFIISGSAGMTGSGCLAASAVLRVGAGLVYLGVPESLAPIYGASLIEPITIPLQDNGAGYLSKNSIGNVLENMKGKNVVAAGPGLSMREGIAEVVVEILKNAEVPLVLDADALNAVSRDVSVLKYLKAGTVITPHPGEMARLTGLSSSDVQSNRIEVSSEFACKWKVVTVLKGARTVVAMPDGTVYINPTGNSGMATGGTGDVLTGIIAGFIAQGASPEDAAVAGVYLHGLTGDVVAQKKGEHGLIASDIVEELPYVMKQVIGEMGKRPTEEGRIWTIS